MLAGAVIIAIGMFLFGDHFQVTENIPVPAEAQVTGEGGWTDWSYCSVNPNGDQAALIDPRSREVLAYSFSIDSAAVLAENYQPSDQQLFFSSAEIESFNYNSWVETVARNGRKPDEVNLPLAVDYTSSGELLVSDMGARRILHFGGDGRLQNSFILTGQVASPNEIRYHPSGVYLAAGLNLDTTSAINAGDYCTVFSPTGKVIRSFAHTPQIALDRNLWVGVSAVMDIGDDGLIYMSFSVEGDIYVYDITGRLIKRFNYSPTWFTDPQSLEKPVFKLQREPVGFWASWTRIICLVYAGDEKLILVGETNGQVPGVTAPFIIDVVSTGGEFLYGGIASEYWPVGRDDDNHIYWMSYAGDHMIKTRVK